MSSQPSSDEPVEDLHPAGCLLRVFWMGFGNILMLSLAASVFRSHGYTWLDVAYVTTVLGMIVARHVDISRFGGMTVDSLPATTRHFHRFAVLLAIVGGALWCLARAAGPGFG